MTVEMLQAVAEALNVTPTFLIGYDEKIVEPSKYTPDELADIKSRAWNAYKEHSEEVAVSEVFDELRREFAKLSDADKEMLLEMARMLRNRMQDDQPPSK